MPFGRRRFENVQQLANAFEARGLRPRSENEPLPIAVEVRDGVVEPGEASVASE